MKTTLIAVFALALAGCAIPAAQAPTASILVDLDPASTDRTVIIESITADRNGVLYVADRVSGEPGPAPQKKPLYLPIAEFDLDLLQKPYPPFPPEEIVEQQKALDFDNGWARPIVLQNLRLAA